MSQVRTFVPNVTAVALKMWDYGLPNRQNWYCCVQIFPKGVYPLNRFLQNLLRGRQSHIRTLTPHFTVVASKGGLIYWPSVTAHFM